MDLLLNEINATNNIDSEVKEKQNKKEKENKKQKENKKEKQNKKERQNKYLDNCSSEHVLSVMEADRSFERIKDEDESEIVVIKRPSKKRRNQKANHPYAKKLHRKEGKSDRSQIPCIINIKSPDVLENASQKNCNGTCDSSAEMPNHSLQSSISENTFASNVYLVLLDIQSTLTDIKAELAETTKKIDQLQKFIPEGKFIPQEKCIPEEKLIPRKKIPPWTWKNVKNDFNFPISTNEQLLELEKKLEDNETANKLFVDLTSRTYTSWREMVLISLKYMLSRNVAVLYNLNGIKGSKKKFRDLHICNILVGSVSQKYKEADVPDILKRISFILAGAGDWHGTRSKNIRKKKA